MDGGLQPVRGKETFLKNQGNMDLQTSAVAPYSPYSCLENPMDGGAWQAAVHGVAGSWTRLSDFTFTLHFHALEKEMAAHSSVLAWRIPGTGKPGWAAVYGVAQSRTRLKRLSSRHLCNHYPDQEIKYFQHSKRLSLLLCSQQPHP